MVGMLIHGRLVVVTVGRRRNDGDMKRLLFRVYIYMYMYVASSSKMVTTKVHLHSVDPQKNHGNHHPNYSFYFKISNTT